MKNAGHLIEKAENEENKNAGGGHLDDKNIEDKTSEDKSIEDKKSEGKGMEDKTSEEKSIEYKTSEDKNIDSKKSEDKDSGGNNQEFPGIEEEKPEDVSPQYVAICDDEEEYRERCRIMCKTYFKKHNQNVKILECGSTEELMEIRQELYLILLDIEMPGMSGIDAKNMLAITQPKAAIIFITSHPEHMREAFGRNVFQFIKKPINPEDMFYAINKINRELILKDDFVVAERKRIILSQVLYIKADDKYVEFRFFADDPIIIRGTLREWEEFLMERGFCRSHKSYLVNLRWVQSVDHRLLLRNKETVPMARREKQRLIKTYLEFLDKRSF